MELTLPMNYVEIEQEEMMYLDGGWQNYILAAVGGAVLLYANSVIGEWGKQFAKKYSAAFIGKKVLALGGLIKATIVGVFNWAWANPAAAVAIVVGVAGPAAYALKRAGY